MENVTSTHQGPIARPLKGNTGGKEKSNEDIETKRRRWRDAYYASQARKRKRKQRPKGYLTSARKRAAARAYYHAHKKAKAKLKVKEVRSGKDNPGPVPKTGNRTDALIYLNKALRALADRDYEGTELFAKLCRRVLQGKE